MFSFIREGSLWLVAGIAGAVATPLLRSLQPAGGFVGGLTIVLPVMAIYALGISAAVRMPARTVLPLGVLFGLAGTIALLLAVPGTLGVAGALLPLLAAVLAWRDGAEVFWRGLVGVGFAGLIFVLVLLRMIPMAAPFVYVVGVTYLLARHLWGVLAHDVAAALRHNADQGD